jgi:large subunit ribosomal protein L25
MTKIDLHEKKLNANQSRKSGMIPVCLYSKDFLKHFVIDKKLFTTLLHSVGGKMLSTLFILSDGKNEFKAIIKEIQIHPVTEQVVHIDFFQVVGDFVVPVLITVKNSERAPFTKENGIVSLPRRRVKILCNEKNIMTHLECDVGNLHKGDAIKTSDSIWKEQGIKFVSEEVLLTIIDK